MDKDRFIRDRVQTYFVDGNDNCTMTSLRIQGEHFETPLDSQVLDAAQCVPGTIGTRETCGLITGGLMFIGVWGAQHHHPRETLNLLAQRMTSQVRHQFGSVCCRDLKVEGGCGSLAVEILFALIPVLADEMEML